MRENFDLRYILERDWATLGPKLVGKIHIYVGEMENSYLNNAVYLMEDFLESTTDPTPCHVCATTRCTCPGSWRGFGRRRRRGPILRVGGTEKRPWSPYGPAG